MFVFALLEEEDDWVESADSGRAGWWGVRKKRPRWS